MQEYVEAKSFEHYLRYQRLIGMGEISTSLPNDINLNVDDYLLGVFDLTGELMRYSITAMATPGLLPLRTSSQTHVRSTVMDLRAVRASLQGLDTRSFAGTGLGRDIERKTDVMKTCVEKVEQMSYSTIVRGEERPQGQVLELAEFE